MLLSSSINVLYAKSWDKTIHISLIFSYSMYSLKSDTVSIFLKSLNFIPKCLVSSTLHLSIQVKKKYPFFGAPGAKYALMCSIQGLTKVDSPMPKCRTGWALCLVSGYWSGWLFYQKITQKFSGALMVVKVWWTWSTFSLPIGGQFFFAISDCNSHFSHCT